MIYLVPSDDGQIANHFMKASSFSVFKNTQLLNEFEHQATEAGSCKTKKAIFEQLLQRKVDAVIVKNIGEKALGKLLSMGIKVFKTNARVTLNTLSQSPMLELTSLDQARPSMQQAQKHKQCCSGDNHRSQNRSCRSRRESSRGNCGHQ